MQTEENLVFISYSTQKMEQKMGKSLQCEHVKGKIKP